jgi:hypothetical protein
MGIHVVEELKTGPVSQEAADKEAKETQDKIDAGVAKAMAQAQAQAQAQAKGTGTGIGTTVSLAA